eukprot:3545190-Pleurochrysis_carterae.AAC.1
MRSRAWAIPRTGRRRRAPRNLGAEDSPRGLAMRRRIGREPRYRRLGEQEGRRRVRLRKLARTAAPECGGSRRMPRPERRRCVA